MSNYEIKVTIVHNGKPVAEQVAGYASLVDVGDAMQRVADALRPKVETLPCWTYPDGEPMPDDSK